MAKKIDPKAKAKKQKIYAAIGGVLLLGLLAFQVPRTMKMLHPPNANESAASTPASTTATTGPIAAPSLGGGNATAVSASPGGDGIADPDAVPLPESGQLLAFGRFRTKDPFVQQLKLDCADSSGAGCASSGPPSTGTSKPPTDTKPTKSRVGSSNSSLGSSAVVAAAPTSAVISVNGAPQTVEVGGNFPSSDPAFTLVSLTAKAAKVGIAGGALENGKSTVTLKKNKPMTLMNTADGTRYVLRFLSVK
ncbi:MAG TPA: hypothetical protein VHQ98_02955 [Gaiellaceae bacterium]|jgi:hypothetical protein|nr:hypothetical protein [Gaiellaceae bacterium]